MENKEKNSVSELMETTMTKIREMVDSNSVIGEPITTPDGVTLIPVSRVSLGFGSGGGQPCRRTRRKNERTLFVFRVFATKFQGNTGLPAVLGIFSGTRQQK